MGGNLIKPYEISVWEDKLTQNGFTETKIAVIGSDTMTGLNKVYNPVFNKKSNGEKTLSFALKYKYFDPYSGNDGVVNPFAALLVNERKVKLHYDGKWYEFIVKDHSESSDGLEWTYTCTDAFVLELSKNGYNITFDTELNNNQGTADELARETLKNTDWQVGGANVGKQLVAEPIYKASLVSTTGISIINASGTQDVLPELPASIYLFYSYVKNQSGKNVQFIIRDEDRQYTIDDKNVITDTNFRITTDLEFKDNGFYLNNNQIISIGETETRYQANRLVYAQRTVYDPVMQRTVDIFKAEDREVYRYTDYTYTTSNVVTNFITNGENFNILEDGSLQGWNPYVDFEGRTEGGKVNKLELVTRPELGTNKELADLMLLSQIEGFLKVRFKGALTNNYENSIFNSGIANHQSIIESISKGDQFVFRWRAATGTINQLKSTNNLGLIVAKYIQDDPNPYRNYYKYIDKNNIVLRFESGLNNNMIPQPLNNYIRGGVLVKNEDDTYSYKIDGVTQTPSTKYIYVDNSDPNEEKQYVWSGLTGQFSLLNENNYLPYYYLIASATKSVTNAELTDPNFKIGIFLYTKDSSSTESIDYTKTFDLSSLPTSAVETVEAAENQTIKVYYPSNAAEPTWTFTQGTSATQDKCAYSADTNTITITDSDGIGGYRIAYEAPKIFYIQDIQLTRYVPDANNQPIIMGNIPTATSTPTEYYYLKPLSGTAAEDVQTYTFLNDLAIDLGLQETDIKPVYNENSEKNLSISVSQSNCFNILQTIAETFECWVDLVVDHDENGYITYTDGKPNKYVYLKEYAGKDNWADFKYGINLNTIERNVNSDEVVTKLIVDSSQSDYVDEGFVSITSAPSNQSGESYIINFDYYYNQGLLNRDEAEPDRLQFITEAARLNEQLRSKEQERRDLETALTKLGSNRNVYTELIETAEDTLTRALAEFEELTGQSYEEYRQAHTTLEEDEQLTEEDTIYEILGEIYTSSATINNYAGIAVNVEQEYWEYRKKLRGSENYSIKIWTGVDDNEQRHVFVELSDFLPGFAFTLGDSTYTSTVSKKYWDLEKNDITITFTAPDGYSIDPTQYDIVDTQVATFKIISNVELKGVEDEIKELQEQKDELVNNFNNKYSRYIQEGTWNSTDYIDSELYYLDALQVSNTSAQPTVSYTINVVEVSELEGLELYDFDAGDKTYVEDTEFFGWSKVNVGTKEEPNYVLTPAREEVIVSEVEWHLDEPDQTVITVQNYKTRFEDLFQRVSAAVQTVQYNEATYAKISSLLDANGTINQNVLLESLNRISGKEVALTSNGSVIIQDDVVLIQNLNNPANRVIINSEGIRVSSDGGQNWQTAIDGEGINIGAVYTGTLNTNQVVIGSDDNPSFRWDKAGISAYKSNEETGIYDLQTFVRYDQYGLYGIKDNGTFKAQSLDDVLDKAHFAVTWDGFFIKNSYEGGGRVEITSDDDFRVLKAGGIEKVKIGALEWGKNGDIPITSPDAEGATVAPTLYGIRIKNDAGAEVMKTGDDGNLTITGTINANAGVFDGNVQVGTSTPHIDIDGVNAVIKSSNYNDGSSTSATYGWMINADGDAVFNNITARGAIKTAVFEYAEIQAVGGIFIFRPSSTIRDAVRVGDTDDIKVTIEKPHLFTVGDWCKISNYIDTMGEPSAEAVISNNGLTHVYKIKSIDTNNSRVLVLENAYTTLTSGSTKVINNITDLIGGVLVDMGNKNNGDGKVGTNNYGIGINSSDNVVNLPRRAISLFETVVDETKNPKVSYNYRGILGTLPHMDSNAISPIYPAYMEGTQGIYTDNMYIGDENQYLAFYEDEQGHKHLKISAREMIFEYDEDTGEEITWEDKIDEATQGADATVVTLTSTIGDVITDGVGQGAVYATVFTGGQEVDPLKTTVFDVEPPTTGNYYYYLDSTNKTCVLKKKVNGEWVVAPSEDEPIYTYTWTFRDKNGQPWKYNGRDSISGKAIYFNADMVDDKIVVLCDVSDNN